jgi:hypothetical protein
MRERAAQELNPEMGRMGAEDPSTAFSAAPLEQRYGPTADSNECSDSAARRS